MRLSPNPSSGYAVLELQNAAPGRVSIAVRDAKGSVVAAPFDQRPVAVGARLPLDLSMLPSGWYVVSARFTSREGVRVEQSLQLGLQ